MKRIGVGREHRAESPLEKYPNQIILTVLVVLLVYLSILKGQQDVFFQLGLIANTTYNALIVITSVWAFFTIEKWLGGDNPTTRQRYISIALAIAVGLGFTFFGEAIGQFFLSVITGP
jgi:hypothetical protein